jgi:hypothetical protein
VRQGHPRGGTLIPVPKPRNLQNRSDRGYGKRARSMGLRELRASLVAKRSPDLAILDDHDRPQTRADCWAGERPCPWAGCKYHLLLDVNPASGSLKVNFPGRELWHLDETCALDVADRGGITLDEVGALLNIVRERVRQIEEKTLLKLKGQPLGED